MSDSLLRKRLIRLAQENPSLRADLLPLLGITRTAATPRKRRLRIEQIQKQMEDVRRGLYEDIEDFGRIRLMSDTLRKTDDIIKELGSLAKTFDAVDHYVET